MVLSSMLENQRRQYWKIKKRSSNKNSKVNELENGFGLFIIIKIREEFSCESQPVSCRMTNQEGLILQTLEGIPGELNERNQRTVLARKQHLLEGTSLKWSHFKWDWPTFCFRFGRETQSWKLALWRIQSRLEHLGVLGCLIMFFRISWEVFWKKRLHKTGEI